MDYLDQKQQPFFDDSAKHHSARFLIPGENQLELRKTRFLLNHSDKQIYELIQKMEGIKHNHRWLFPREKNYN